MGTQEDGTTALMLAVEYDHDDIVSILFDRPELNGNTTTLTGDTALAEAVRVGNADVLAALLSRPDVVQQINRRDNWGLSMLDEARMVDHPGIESYC